MNKVLASVLAISVGYVAACWNAGQLLRFDATIATVPQLLSFAGAAVVTLLLISMAVRLHELRRLHTYTAHPERVKAVADYMAQGVASGSFAYNLVPFEYNGGELLPMSTVYVVQVEGDQALVIPQLPGCEKSYAVFIEVKSLLKYVPPHLVPQMLPL